MRDYCDKHHGCKKWSLDEEPIMFKFKKINEVFRADMNNMLKENDLTCSQFEIIKYLKHNTDHLVSQKELSLVMHVKHSTTAGLVKRLEEKGLVEVRINEDNRKYNDIVLTPKAKTSLKSSEKGHIRMADKVLNDFNKEETAQVRAYLDRIYKNITEE